MSESILQPCEPGAIILARELRKTTLAELGQRLPHGVLGEPGRVTTYAFRPPTLGTKKRQGALRQRRDLAQRPGAHAAAWLAAALAELDGQDLERMKPDEAAHAVSRLTQGDVLYLMFAWQATCHPDGWPLSGLGCGTCGYTFDRVRVDLGTMGIDVLPDEASLADPLAARVGLKRGFAHPKDKTVRTVLVGSPSWADSMLDLPVEAWSNNDLLVQRLIRASIRMVDTTPARSLIPTAALDELWPEDVHLLTEAIGRVAPGPHTSITVACPSCEAENTTALDWRDPGFFQS